MSTPFTVIIPARLASSRLPEKALVDIAGKPMVVRVAERAKLSEAQRVVVATDSTPAAPPAWPKPRCCSAWPIAILP